MSTSPSSATYRDRVMQRSHSSTVSSSEGSQHSRSTAPTEYSPHIVNIEKGGDSFSAPFFTEDPRDSNSTYASTVPSYEDLPNDQDQEQQQEPRYEVVTERQETFASSAIPSNSATFADLFPSGRRLLIHHDDSTLDGNMNLRVDTLLSRRDRSQQEVTLFHLRMHDLHSRNFSFRRYCRDSGREVCHSRRLTHEAHSQRPTLRRSWSSVLNGLRPGSGSSDKHSVTGFLGHNKQQSLPKASPLQELMDDECMDTPRSASSTKRNERLTNTMLLEFCNYAHVELSRVGVKPSKRYEFEYWSTRYQWRRESRKEGDLNEISYHLVNLEIGKTVAYIVPEILTSLESTEEAGKGGWVPRCSMWISDSSVYERMSDVADVIIATGIMVLVDDSIRRRWHNKRHVILNLGNKRASTFMRNLNVDYIGPKRLIDEMFHRRGSA